MHVRAVLLYARLARICVIPAFDFLDEEPLSWFWRPELPRPSLSYLIEALVVHHLDTLGKARPDFGQLGWEPSQLLPAVWEVSDKLAL